MAHPMTVGEKIMVARHRRGLTRQDLGEQVYIDRKIKPGLKFPDGRLKKIETGVIAEDRFLSREIETIAEVLKMPMDFFGNAEPPATDSAQLVLDPLFCAQYPELKKYFDLLNTTLHIDRQICADVFARMADYVAEQSKSPASPQTHS